MTWRAPVARVTTRVVGFHHWPDATAPRDYLGATHRHVFHISCELELLHDDREVEFHDLLDVVRLAFGTNGQDHGRQSCEQMARRVAERVRDVYPHRSVAVEVSEDGECGALVEWRQE